MRDGAPVIASTAQLILLNDIVLVDSEGALMIDAAREAPPRRSSWNSVRDRAAKF